MHARRSHPSIVASVRAAAIEEWTSEPTSPGATFSPGNLETVSRCAGSLGSSQVDSLPMTHLARKAGQLSQEADETGGGVLATRVGANGPLDRWPCRGTAQAIGPTAFA